MRQSRTLKTTPPSQKISSVELSCYPQCVEHKAACKPLCRNAWAQIARHIQVILSLAFRQAASNGVADNVRASVGPPHAKLCSQSQRLCQLTAHRKPAKQRISL